MNNVAKFYYTAWPVTGKSITLLERLVQISLLQVFLVPRSVIPQTPHEHHSHQHTPDSNKREENYILIELCIHVEFLQSRFKIKIHP